MAEAPLTELEKTKCLFYLGYSIFEDNGPAMRALSSLDAKPLAGVFIRPILAELERIDCQVKEVAVLAKAIADGSVQVRAHYTLSVLYKMGRTQVGRLATLIKVSVFSDVFSRGMGGNFSEFYSGDPSEPRIDQQLGTWTTRS